MRELEPSQASLVAAAMGPEGDLVEQRLARGCRCFVFWIERAVGGYGWLSTGPEWIGEVQLEISPRSGEGYVWNCFTVAEHRRQGIFKSLLVGMVSVARREGLKRLWIGSVAIPAERAMGPLGFRPALRSTALTVAGWQVLLVAESPERALSADARAVLGIGPGVHLRRSMRVRH